MTQTGSEKELVLGNKQLLAVFFVGTMLCAVFFAMGYMVGSKSAKTAVLSTDPSANPVTTTDSAHRQQSEPPRETVDNTVPAQSPSTEDSAPPIATKPAQDVPVPQTAAPPVQDPPVEKKFAHVSVTTPEAGATYLQVTALPHPDADNLVRTLREQSFPAMLADSSKEGLFRVLVGPYHQTAQLAEAKGKLKTLGFANAFVQRQ